MHIRRLRLDHWKAVREIWEDCFLAEGFRGTDLGHSWRNRSHQESVGVFDGDNLLGFAIVSFHKRNKGNRYIDYIAVHSSYRGCGYGNRLMNHLLQKARTARRGIHLYPLDHAISWYTKHGFYWSTSDYMNKGPYHHDHLGRSSCPTSL